VRIDIILLRTAAHFVGSTVQHVVGQRDATRVHDSIRGIQHEVTGSIRAQSHHQLSRGHHLEKIAEFLVLKSRASHRSEHGRRRQLITAIECTIDTHHAVLWFDCVYIKFDDGAVTVFNQALLDFLRKNQ